MAKTSMENILSSINTAGVKTADTLKKVMAELKKKSNGSAGSTLTARQRILAVLDEGTFSEIGAYTFRKSNEYDTDEGLESVICGWGAVNGTLVYIFSQNYEQSKGAVSEAHAKKIADLYRLAIENGSPIIGLFDSAGAVIPEGVKALSGFASLMSCSAMASGVIPQIAIIPGICAGTASVLASMFDFIVITEKTGSMSLNSPFVINCSEVGKSKFASETGLASLVAKNDTEASDKVRKLLSIIPSNNFIGAYNSDSTDDANRLLDKKSFKAGGDIRSYLKELADNGEFFELYADYAPSFVTGFIGLGNNQVGVIASNHAANEGKLTIQAARKASRFLSFCDSFNVPVLTVLDTVGPDVSLEAEQSTYAAEVAKLASLYASAKTPLVTLLAGEAYGCAFTVLGSKGIGADVVYAFESAKVGSMSARSAVTFLWNEQINENMSREDLEKAWDATCGSPAVAASTGEIDDIISVEESRMHIAAAFEMLACKSKSGLRKRHSNMPL